MVSDNPVVPSPLSVTIAVLVTSIAGAIAPLVKVTVGSFSVFPSVSSPSSLMSKISFVFPGLLAIAVTVFDTPPASIACWVMIKLAV